jgi:hypothetical protein
VVVSGLALLKVVRSQFHDHWYLSALRFSKAARARFETLKAIFLLSLRLSYGLLKGIWVLLLATQEALGAWGTTFWLAFETRVVWFGEAKHRAFVPSRRKSLRLFPLVTGRQSSWGTLWLLLDQPVDWDH